MIDGSVRFVFTDADVRGNIVRLGPSYEKIVGPQTYPIEVQTLLGEFLVASLLLSDTIKFEGRLTIQLNGTGAIRLLMAEATHKGTFRGIARFGDEAKDMQYAGKNIRQIVSAGTLTVTVEPEGGERYQSIVPLAGDTLSECLESYFQQSEQLNTFIRVFANREQVTGILIQQLPAQLEKDMFLRRDRWEIIEGLAKTVTASELMSDTNKILLQHLFSEQNVEIFDGTAIQFQCSCSEERMAGALVSLGETELEGLFEEGKELKLKCEFCGVVYSIGDKKLSQLIADGRSLH